MRQLLTAFCFLAAFAAAAQEPVTLDASKLARLDGRYDLAGAVLEVTHEGTQLFAKLGAQERYPVFPRSESRFYYKIVAAELVFDLPEKGRATQVTLHQNGKEIPAKRMTETAASKSVVVSEKVLAEYAGRYELAPDVVFDVQVAEEHLTVQLTGQPRFDIYPDSEKDFHYDVINAQITFERDASGKVTGLVLHQGGADRPAKRLS